MSQPRRGFTPDRIAFDELADRTSLLVEAGLHRYCKICHSAPGFDCTNPVDGGPLPGRVIHIERATREGKS